MLGARIEDQSYQSRMGRGEANKNALMGTTVPFRNLLAILQAGVQNMNRTTKNVNTREARAWAFNAREKLFWGKTTTMMGKFVVHQSGVVHGQRP